MTNPVHELWECLGRWSAYLVTNGHGADREGSINP